MSNMTFRGSDVTMSSREIAELTGKRHDNVMADVRTMLAELGLASPEFLGHLPDAYGRLQPVFNLPKDLTITLVSGYSVVMRHRIVTRLQELETRRPQMTSIAANDNLVIAETIARTLNIEGSAKLGMMRKAVALFSPQHVPLLPDYAIDSPAGSAVISSEATAALSELLAAHGVRKSAQAVNRILEDEGLLETLERKSSKCEDMRKFKSVTVAGQRYGKNVTSDRNPRETQPHWYRATFSDLLMEIGLAKKAA